MLRSSPLRMRESMIDALALMADRSQSWARRLTPAELSLTDESIEQTTPKSLAQSFPLPTRKVVIALDTGFLPSAIAQARATDTGCGQEPTAGMS